MTAAEIRLLWLVAGPLAGELLRSHAPRLWPFLAPLFGAAPPAGPGPAAAPSGEAHALAHYERGKGPGLDEDELHYQLAMYVAKAKTTERLKTMLAQAHAAACQKGGAPAPSAD